MTLEGKTRLIDEIISCIVCSDAWSGELIENPEIRESTAQLESALKAIEPLVPFEQMEDLESSIYSYSGTYERISLLKGLYLVDILRDVAARPSDYAELVNEKLKEVKRNVRA